MFPILINALIGAIAQLGERLTGSQEVVGSIPTSSTNKYKGLRCHDATLFLFGATSVLLLRGPEYLTGYLFLAPLA